MNLHQNLHHFNLISQDDVGHGRKIKCFFNQNHKNAYKIGLFRNLSAVIERQRISSYILQAYREQAETPLVLGEEFSIEVTIDVERFLEAYEASSSKIFYVTAMVCQNHEPGEVDLAGMSFDSSICLVPNGSGGCTLRVIER